MTESLRSKETLDAVLIEFDKLERDEQTAFTAWFAGGNAYLTQYQSRKDDVPFGKAECEWVPFEAFWLGTLPKLGWVHVEELERFIAKGMVGTPEGIKYKILPTDLGFTVHTAYIDRIRRAIAEND